MNLLSRARASSLPWPIDSRLSAGHIAVILAYTAWGLLPAYWKMLSGVDPRAVLLSRCLFATVILAVLLFARDGLRILNLRAKLSRAVIAMLSGAAILLTVNWLTYLYAVEQGELVAASLGYLLCPIFTILLGAFALGEGLSRRQWAGIACMALGMAARAAALGKPPWYAILLAGSFSCYTMLKKRIPLGPIEALFFETLLMLVPASVLMYASGAAFPEWSDENRHLYFILLCAGPVTAIPLMLLSSGARQASMRFIGLAQYLTPVLILMSAVAWCGESITPADLVSFPVVGAGVAIFLSSRSARKNGAAAGDVAKSRREVVRNRESDGGYGTATTLRAPELHGRLTVTAAGAASKEPSARLAAL